MADMTPLTDILNNDPATAVPVQNNFQTIEAYINGTDLVRTDGTEVMAASLDMDGNKIVNLDDGTAAGDAVNKGQLDARTPYLSVDVQGTDVTSNVIGPTTILFDTENTDVDSIAGASSITIGTAGFYGLQIEGSLNTAVTGSGGPNGDTVTLYSYVDGASVSFTTPSVTFANSDGTSTKRGSFASYLAASQVITLVWSGTTTMTNTPTLSWRLRLYRLV